MDFQELKNKIDKQLLKNRDILKSMNSEGKTLVHQKQLKESGFDFNCFTDVYKAKNGNTYKLCYDVGYKELDLTKEVLIVDRQDYM